ncbi:hypothetical protein LUD75_03995 [Epilithonimonas sp. JDS]|uniref:hypothetical protein n=1 Tax=Epilithonimonas sp. JDS TaxID=2902797 RepID=UPI001E5887B4|nr:hypothetical protein [Epilithonimonas sp. JDS]MCD9853849.1 hypothetical protein [Epilithonimonas sp. JDS]
MENENQEYKSNGMEILENVVKSNERNIASNLENKESNAEVKADIKDLVLAIRQLQLDFEAVKEIPTKIEIVLSQETSDFYEDFYKKMKMKEKFNRSGLGVFILGIFTLMLSITFATNWYKESIKAKSELRQDILNEIAVEGKKIYDENEIRILSENTQVMQLWIKNNPKKAEDFLRFKDGFQASKENK